jgi:Flp pilus assembly protein TadB
VSEIATPSGQQPADSGRPGDGYDVGRLMVFINAALVGVPSAYAASGSLAVTVIAAALACVLVVTYLVRRRH